MLLIELISISNMGVSLIETCDENWSDRSQNTGKTFLQPLFSKFSCRFLNPQISFANLNSNCSNALDLETK